ncbi:YciI family protein [Rhizobium rhizogenes]|uniref:YciI family protein n=1 Tax=Rhizobium rhizogenes TaxID=359 RepID=UPI001572D792|nr:YciI family protein [Rhizobium rhizogenes]NTF88433.1 YciI family protein [Rhizobium rhizogenes]
MQYMLLVYWNEAEHKNAKKEQKAETFAAYAAYTEVLKKAGAFLAGSGLQDSSTATVVRAPDGKTSVLNGPYIESKEQLGGYYLIEAPDLDSALVWAARCPGAQHDTVEVRPLMVY